MRRARLVACAGEHCERAHDYLMQQPRDLGQVHADEIRIKMQGSIVCWRWPSR